MVRDKQNADTTLAEWNLLLPCGRVQLGTHAVPLQVNPPDLPGIVAAFHSRGEDLAINYESRSLQDDGSPAPGWIKDLEVRGDGLWGRMERNPQALEYLYCQGYRFFSLTLQLEPVTNKPRALMRVELTNVPAIKVLPPVWKMGGPGGFTGPHIIPPAPL